MRFDLTGKVALITGGARGIGFATGQALIARGAKVVVLDVRPDAATAAAERLGAPDRAFGIGADVADLGALQRAVREVVERFGGLDVVVANAGIAPRGATARAMHAEAFERVLDVDLYGVWRTVQVALPEIVARRGHIVVISSVYAFMNGVGVAPYAMAKAGVEALGRALRVELAARGASATVAHFGFIDTEMVQQGIDHDPLGDRLKSRLPRVLRKRLPPAAAGEGIARAIEARAPRLVLPRRWYALFVLRGILGPALDGWMERDAELQALVGEFDARAGEEQPTTAPA